MSPSRDEDSDSSKHDVNSDRDDQIKPKPKNKTLHRIQKNISSYLNDPTPAEKNKQVILNPVHTIKAHQLNVEDLSFTADNSNVFCSVGIDRKLKLWDLRSGTSPVATLNDLHSSDINACDWSKLNTNLIATGSNDTFVKIVDTRRAYQDSSKCILKVLAKHKAKVQSV